jgi:hypothetical protein
MNLKERIAEVARCAGVNPKQIREYPGLLQKAKELIPAGEEYPEGYDELKELKRIHRHHKYADPCWRKFKPRYIECQYCGGYWQCLDMRIALLEAELEK